MSCIYKYKGHTFNSEAELDDFLIEKFGYESKFGDIVFNKSSNFLRTKDIIENKIMKEAKDQEHLMKIRNARLRASYYDGEEILDLKPPYVGVNKFLSGLEHPEKGLLMPEFRLDEEYWPRRREKWTSPLKSDENLIDRFTDDEINIFFEADPGKTYSSKKEEFEDKKKNVRLLNEDECKLLETLMKKKWEFQAAAGTAIHYVLQQYFTKDGDTLIGDQPRDVIIEKIKSTIDKDLSEQMGDSKYRAFRGSLFNDKIIEEAVIFADKLKSELRKKHGDDCEFYPELSISANLAMTSSKPELKDIKTILGIIDLLVVDKNGQVHYYDYKTSPKPYDKFDKAKKRTYSYQLAMYGKLLKRYGLNYRNSNISILPILFEDLDLSNPDEAHLHPEKAQFSYKGLIPKDGLFETDTSNRIFEVSSTGEEKILDVLDDYVPEDLVLDVTGDEMLSNIEEQEKTWFPDLLKFKAKSDTEIEKLLEDEGALNPVERDGKQIFTYLSKGIYSKEITASSKFELIEKVKKAQEKQEKRAEWFANTAEKALEYGIDNMNSDIGNMLKSIDSKSLPDSTSFAKWFTEKLGMYCNGNWKIRKLDALKPLGIIVLENLRTHLLDIVKLSSSNLFYNPFDTEIKNGKRKRKRNSLLSYAFQNDIVETSLKSLMLDGKKGNVELIETILALNNIPLLFEGDSGAVIGNIQVMNPFQGTGISAPNEQILYSFKKMSLLSPLKVTNNVVEGKVKLGSTFDIGINSFNEAMESSSLYEIDNTLFNSAKSLLDEAIEHKDKEEKIEAINNILLKLENAHEDLKKGKVTREMLLTKPYARLYNELLQALRYLHGINFSLLTEDHDKWLQERTFKGIITRGASGTYIDNPGNMLSETLNTVAKLVTQAYQNIRNIMGGRVSEIRKATEELKLHKLYTGIAQGFGNATDMYKNMTEVVGGDLLFTDLRSDKLDDVERKYLKLILEIINENRFGGKKSKEELERMRDSHDLAYYRVPLCKATAESQDSVIGLLKGLKDRLKRFNPKTAMNDIAASVNGLFMEENVDEYQNGEFLFQMNNRFDRSEGSPQYRIDSITKNGAGYFERNLEMLAFKHSYAYISSKELNKVFPIMKAAMTYLSAAGNTVNKTFVNDEEYFENYIKSSIKGQQIQKNDDMKQATAVAGRVKQIASFMALAVSPVQALYQTIQGLWLDISLIIRKPDGTHAFTLKNMYDAAKEVYKDLMHFSDKPTKCLLINEWLGVNDMDMNIYAEHMRTDLHNKYNLVNFAFKFTSRPDFYNRMTIVIAKMKADGIWDALEVKDGKLVYNFKEDKRFKAYASGNTSDPNYNNQRALYKVIADQFITEGTTNPDGTKFLLSKDPMHPAPLPYAWTNQESESIKSLCDLIYGYYSHEKKSLIHSTFLGALYMQMKTYWSGKKNQYLLPGGVRIQGKWEQASDENGKPLYYQLDKNGMIDTSAPLTTKVTNAPFYQWKGLFLEGVILTLSNLFREGILSKEGLKKGWEETWNNEDINIRTIRRANIKLAGFDIIWYLLIGWFIAGICMMDWDKELLKEAKESGELSDAFKASLAHLTRLSFGQSADDLAWWSSIGNPAVNWSPFSITQVTNLGKRASSTLFGDTSFYDGITKSFAVGKQMKPLVDWLNPKNFD